MSALIIFIHVVACVLLATIILMQSGRGGGLTEQFAQAGEVFGARTNEMLVKFTTILSVIFFVTCLSLAILSASRGKSLMRHVPASSGASASGVPAALPSSNVPEAAAPSTAPASK